MYLFSGTDSKWDLLKKILLNQNLFNTSLSSIITALGGSLSSTVSSGTDTTVAVAGTAVNCAALASGSRGIQVTAAPGNDGLIYIGDSTVTNAAGARRGTILVPGGTAFFGITNANLLWINADDNGSSAGIVSL